MVSVAGTPLSVASVAVRRCGIRIIGSVGRPSSVPLSDWKYRDIVSFETIHVEDEFTNTSFSTHQWREKFLDEQASGRGG
jgi:hypothetical protein